MSEFIEETEPQCPDELETLPQQLRTAFVPGNTVSVAIEPETPPELQVKTYGERMAQLDLVIEGNPYLKETLARRIEDWEQSPSAEAHLLQLARRMRLSVPEVESLCQKRIEELMHLSEFFCATRPNIVLDHILRGDERYKSQIELYDTGAVSGPWYRSSVENKVFGFPQYDTPEGKRGKSSRPIYGYFSLNENGILNHSGTHPPPNDVHFYGKVTVKIKPETAIKRATMCLVDSFATEAPLCPVALPHYSALFHSSDNTEYWNIIDFLHKPVTHDTLWAIYNGYTEAQYHGGLTVDDIASVHLSPGNGLTQEELDGVAAAVEAYNRQTSSNIAVVMY